jgi:tetratricopeptide (TPR) repeat protein
MPDTSESPTRQVLRAQELFNRGNDASLKSNHDYAIQMYREACRLVPDNLTYRQALRGITRRKFNNDPAKVSKLVGTRNQPILMKARSEKGKGHWDRVLDICEDAFLNNPWDVGAARDAAEAASHLNFGEVACWLIDSVFPQAETDKPYLIHAAQIYEAHHQFQKAIACWERVRKLDPYNDQAKRQINALSASATILRSGLQEAVQKSTDEAARSDARSAQLDELKQPVESLVQRLMREIQEDPTRIGPYLELADHHRAQNKLDEAEKVLAAGRKAMPDDELMRANHTEIQMLRLRNAIAHWVKKAELDPDRPEIQERLRELREKLDLYELNERRHRVKVQPADAAARLEYGTCLARLGKHDEAIAEFQQARGMGNPSQKVDALFHSGKSFEAKGLAKLAERSYLDALKLADADDQALINSLHYRIARVAEAEGNLNLAEEHYNEVAANDYTYLDVAERLRALNQKHP